MSENKKRSDEDRERKERANKFDAWVSGVLANRLQLEPGMVPLCIEGEPDSEWFSAALRNKGYEPAVRQFQDSKSILDTINKAIEEEGGKAHPVFIDGIQAGIQSKGFRAPLNKELFNLAFDRCPRVIQTQNDSTSWRELILCPLAQALANGCKAIVPVSGSALGALMTRKARARLISSGIVERVIFFPPLLYRQRSPQNFLLLSRGNDEIVFEDHRDSLRGENGFDNPVEPLETRIPINDLLRDSDVALDSWSFDFRLLFPDYDDTLADLGASLKIGYRIPDRRGILKGEPVPIGEQQETFRYVSITDFKDGYLAGGGNYIDVPALYDNPRRFGRAQSIEEFVSDLKDHHSLKVGDILTQRMTPTMAHEMVPIFQLPKGMTLIPSDNIIVIRCENTNALDYSYLAAYLNGERGVRRIATKLGRGRSLHFSGRDLLKLPIRLLPHNEQEEIGSQYREVTEQIAEHYREIERLLAERDKIVERAAGPEKDE